jgi:acetoacetate decarboxylase
MDPTGSFPLKGYMLPLSPKGKASVIDAPPWYYGGEILHIVFRADPARVAPFLPPPLEPGPEPGRGVVWFTDWVSVSETTPDLAFVNPERANYRECIVMLACQYRGVPGYFVTGIWVDNDFTLLRGFVQGFPKKLARVYVTRLHELNPRVGGRRPGAKVKGICEAYGQRIVEGSMTFTRSVEPGEVPPVKFYLMRHYPDIEQPDKAVVHEITVGKVADAKIAGAWAGEGDVSFFESPFEELTDLGPIVAEDAFYFSLGFSITGGEVIHRY